MADKVTTILMVVKVDLECLSCDKKIKKILAKFPEIRDQVYDVKKGTVTITVVCCNPEKIRDKLCYKGGKTIKGIEIKVPSKQKLEKLPEDTEKKPPAQKEAPPLVLVPVPGYPPCYPVGVCCGPCYYEGYGWGPWNRGHGLPVPYYDNYGYPRGWYCSRCDYISEESPFACTIM